jgi:hypothetical protein
VPTGVGIGVQDDKRPFASPDNKILDRWRTTLGEAAEHTLRSVIASSLRSVASGRVLDVVAAPSGPEVTQIHASAFPAALSSGEPFCTTSSTTSATKLVRSTPRSGLLSVEPRRLTPTVPFLMSSSPTTST